MSYPQISYSNTYFVEGSFWGRLRRVVKENTVSTQLAMLKKTGRYDVFKLQWHSVYADEPTVWPVPNNLFWDSDVAKWIEEACYFLSEEYDETIGSAVEELVAMIRGAQQPDGYINSHFTVVEPEKRFSNLRDLHELYNAGHLIEAAIIHHKVFKNNDLLDPILKYIDLIEQKIGPAGIKGYPGHPEIELALLRLYDTITHDPKHLALAKYFISERGTNNGEFYTCEAESRGDRPHELQHYYPSPKSYWYQQAHKPILEQETIEGHSVRAMYLLTAVADLVRLDKSAMDEGYWEACTRLWNNMVGQKMSITGGIGAIKKWEGFGINYFLPNSTDEGGCYNETCAAIGVVMLADRMLRVDRNAEYADVAEISLFNALLTGMSLDGKAFTYVNQLGSSDSDPSERYEWFECACCPPNVSRNMGFLAGYVWWGEDSDQTSEIVINHFVHATLTYKSKQTGISHKLSQKTEWPWKGDIEFTLESDGVNLADLWIRIPSWAISETIVTLGSSKFKVTEANPFGASLKKGYLHITGSSLKRYDTKLALTIPMAPRLLTTHPFTREDVLVVARGPLIYCVEDVDHPWVTDHFKSLGLIESATFEEEIQNDGVIFLKSKNTGVLVEPELEEWQKNTSSMWSNEMTLKARQQRSRFPRVDLRFIPYFYRANRGGKGHMRVPLIRVYE
ncbi:putative DUF1680 domain protein [Dipodascopsis uninucleata]